MLYFSDFSTIPASTFEWYRHTKFRHWIYRVSYLYNLHLHCVVLNEGLFIVNRSNSRHLKIQSLCPIVRPSLRWTKSLSRSFPTRILTQCLLHPHPMVDLKTELWDHRMTTTDTYKMAKKRTASHIYSTLQWS